MTPEGFDRQWVRDLADLQELRSSLTRRLGGKGTMQSGRRGFTAFFTLNEYTPDVAAEWVSALIGLLTYIGEHCGVRAGLVDSGRLPDSRLYLRVRVRLRSEVTPNPPRSPE